MDLFESITKRHSYRGPFKPEPVSREDLERIVQAWIQAPSGCNAQSTTFVIADDPELLQKACGVLSFARVPPAMIVCVTDPSPVYAGNSFEVQDCSAAVENMLLAITALGYATVWIEGQLYAERRAERLAELLGVPSGKSIQVVLPLGLPVEDWPQKEKAPFAERAWFNGYGGGA
jgi:nitroreductase